MRNSWLVLLGLTAATLGPAARASAGVNVMFFGGFGSCSINGDPAELRSGEALDELVSKLTSAQGSVADYRACFAVGSSRLFVRVPSGEVFETTPDEAIPALAEAFAASPEPTILLGQSHGGTLAARLASAMNPGHVRLLVTIDPISIETCGPGAFSGSYLDWLLSGEGGNGCTGLPEEIGRWAHAMLDRTDRWMNLFQEDFGPLHSGSAPMADIDLRLVGLDDSAIMGQHAATEVDPGIWARITEEALRR